MIFSRINISTDLPRFFAPKRTHIIVLPLFKCMPRCFPFQQAHRELHNNEASKFICLNSTLASERKYLQNLCPLSLGRQ